MDEKNSSTLWFVTGAVVLISLLASAADFFNSPTGDVVTGDVGHGMMRGGFQPTLFIASLVLKFLGLLGIILLIWIWVIKLWKETFKKR